MLITHYLYNAFVINSGQTKIAIDPGQHLGLSKLRSLIPKSEWPAVTHILVTHGDPDHYWQADRLALASDADVICGSGLARTVDGQTKLVHPRGRGLSSWISLNHTHLLNVGESVDVKGVTFDAIKTTHGPIAIPLLGFTIRKKPGPNERVGIGAMGFMIRLNGVSVLNLGDSIMQSEWRGLKPDVLMLPIGGLGNNTWTMDTTEALQAVELINPAIVIPCHFNVPFFWIKNAAPANALEFKNKVEQLGVQCEILGAGDSINV